MKRTWQMISSGLLATAAVACGSSGSTADPVASLATGGSSGSSGSSGTGAAPSAPLASPGDAPPSTSAAAGSPDEAPAVSLPLAGMPAANPGEADAGVRRPGAAAPESVDPASMAPPTDCNEPPAPSELVGWASEGAGTSGGGAAAPEVVTTADEFAAAVRGGTPRVVHVRGSIEGIFSVGSNKTVLGLCGAQVRGHLGINGSSNTIVRNLKVVGFNCSDSPGDCSGGDDAITVGEGSDHIWIDHLDVSDGSDGNLDITQGADFVTVSWTKFSYSSRRSDPLAGDSGHRFSNLIGASDTDPSDPGHLDVTYHHCWWADNVDQRMPRTRRGQIHVFDNLYTSAGNSYCTDAGFEARLLVQNNVYIGVNRPLEVRDGGDMRAEGNVFQAATDVQAVLGAGFTPPYAFSLDDTSGLEAALRAGVGPH